MFENISLMFVQYPAIWVTTALLVCLCIGSFLNVVIHRLPKMLEKEFLCECREYLTDELKKPSNDQQTDQTYNLVKPNSTCPSCNTAIKPWHNIPIFGWLTLRGKCANCQNPISVRYPLVELLTGVTGAFAAWYFGYGLAAFAAIIFTCLIIAMTFIDLDSMLLPDQLTLPLLWLGLLVNYQAIFVPLHDAVLGAVLGYLALWSIFWLFKLVTGKEGMGYGDFKLLAALGAWMGYQALLPIILISSFVGAVLGIIILKTRKDEEQRIPFGPYLAIAGWIAFYWRDNLIHFYLHNFVY
ncbi:prepilin peptidase [Saccharobesus litoralis]|uniref:Prepilin leader peptidase/N-methyltransferase n=1 Tax=Saccharobesus litoralis TaxID=2172099 RepID=A0A2S0VWY0_9ALTE|nr:A24 family peptidase [Saccharobesus litoralis]AWB68727.1 prepilin peptidase [Saccharobesus litoralis]